MNAILIVDNSKQKIQFLQHCLKDGPEELREIPHVIAFTKEEAMQIIAQQNNLRSGLIDCHLDMCQTLDGPEIIRYWRKLEAEQGRQRAFIALQSAASVESPGSRAALEAGADDVACTEYQFLANDEIKSPVDSIREILIKMIPYFAKK